MTRPLAHGLAALLLLLAGCGEKDGPADDSADPLADADGDGFPAATDCDDGDAAVFPGAEEVCDGVDQDCDGEVDVGATDAPAWSPDLDGDGHGAGATVSACEAPEGHVASADDCDDTDGAIFPGAAEACDGVDEDCDGDVDEDPADGGTWYPDDDGDGYGDASAPRRACEQPPGTIADGQDCDDEDAAVNPEGQEACNGYDDDCDDLVDDADDSVDPASYYTFVLDLDGDGWGSADSGVVSACEAPEGATDQVGDCNDDDPRIHPGARETWYDGTDSDCSGDNDMDVDGDGHDADFAGGRDCDDRDPMVNPDYDESVDCSDPVDYNCDGSVGFDDLDGDGWAACLECDDTEPSVNPLGFEDDSDGLDNDCDGAIDADDLDLPADLNLANDDASRVSLSNLSFPFCGSTATSVYVNSNGVLSFTGSMLDHTESQGEFLGSSGEGPLIAPLWTDLDPSARQADGVYWLETSEALFVWWRSVPETGATATNDLTVALYPDGSMIMAFPEVSALNGVVGWSCGTRSGSESDLSAEWASLPSGATGLGQGTEEAVFEHFKSDDADLGGQVWWFCGDAGADADGDGWTDTCGDSDDADASVYPQ